MGCPVCVMLVICLTRTLHIDQSLALITLKYHFRHFIEEIISVNNNFKKRQYCSLLLNQEKRTAPRPFLPRLSGPGKWPSCPWPPRPHYSAAVALRHDQQLPNSGANRILPIDTWARKPREREKSRRDSSNCLSPFYKHREGKQKKTDDEKVYRYSSNSLTTLH